MSLKLPAPCVSIHRTLSVPFSIGNLQQGAGTDYFKGIIDEVRLSSVARSPSYITASYNNQNNPSTFYTLA